MTATRWLCSSCRRELLRQWHLRRQLQPRLQVQLQVRGRASYAVQDGEKMLQGLPEAQWTMHKQRRTRWEPGGWGKGRMKGMFNGLPEDGPPLPNDTETGQPEMAAQQGEQWDVIQNPALKAGRGAEKGGLGAYNRMAVEEQDAESAYEDPEMDEKDLAIDNLFNDLAAGKRIGGRYSSMMEAIARGESPTAVQGLQMWASNYQNASAAVGKTAGVGGFRLEDLFRDSTLGSGSRGKDPLGLGRSIPVPAGRVEASLSNGKVPDSELETLFLGVTAGTPQDQAVQKSSGSRTIKPQARQSRQRLPSSPEIYETRRLPQVDGGERAKQAADQSREKRVLVETDRSLKDTVPTNQKDVNTAPAISTPQSELQQKDTVQAHGTNPKSAKSFSTRTTSTIEASTESGGIAELATSKTSPHYRPPETEDERYRYIRNLITATEDDNPLILPRLGLILKHWGQKMERRDLLLLLRGQLIELVGLIQAGNLTPRSTRYIRLTKAMFSTWYNLLSERRERSKGRLDPEVPNAMGITGFQSRLPSKQEIKRICSSSSRFDKRLQSIFPKLVEPSDSMQSAAPGNLIMSALLVVVYFHQKKDCLPPLNFNAKPELLVETFASLASGASDLPSSQAWSESMVSSGLPADLAGQMAEEFTELLASGIKLSGNQQLNDEVALHYVDKLHWATGKNKVQIAERLWNEAQIQYRKMAQQAAHVEIPVKVYDAFLVGFMALHRPDLAVDVWNCMIRNGCQPLISSYTAMMVGCNYRRDAAALETVWQKMLKAGIQPDTRAWTARLSGLFSSGRYNEGLAALSEMSRTWLNAVRTAKHQEALQQRKTKTSSDSTTSKGGDKESVASVHAAHPDITTLTAIISALARAHGQRHDEMIQRALSWGEAAGIKPGIEIYNSLILRELRQGRTAKGMNYLRTMEQRGIEPDIATFTILLKNRFHDTAFATSSPEEIEQAVFDFISLLEARGLKPTPQTYTVMLDGLLNVWNNLPAANAVFRHMKAKNFVPASHHYTILAKHYFRQDPPDIRAIDELWTRIGGEKRGAKGMVDNVMYDTFLDGYTRLGHMSRAMQIIDAMTKAGRSPRWRDATLVLEKLAERGDWERAKMVVADVRGRRGMARVGLRIPGVWKGRFWECVRGYGLGMVGEEGVEGEAGGEERGMSDVGESYHQEEMYRMQQPA